MNIAVIGKGKTGGEVVKLTPASQMIGPFGRSNPPTIEALEKADVGIVFVPGDAFLELLPLLLKTKLPLLIGATGMELPKDLNSTLKKNQTAWMMASNFSVGVQTLHQLVKKLNQLKPHLPAFKAVLTDIHHIHKKDSPSGTAKSIQSWCNFPVEIDARREGDVVGIHGLSLDFAQENLTLTHTAHSRELFAQGALSLCESWQKMPLGFGLFTIENYYDSFEF